MLISHSEAEAILQPYKKTLYDCVALAGETYWSPQLNHIRHNFSPRTRANIIHDLMVANARSMFDGIEGICFLEFGGIFLIEIDNKIVLRFKKLNEDKRSSNIPTLQAVNFLEQLDLPGIPSHTRLIVGYELNNLHTEIATVTITCPNGEKNEWYFEIEGEEPIQTAEVIAFPVTDPPIIDMPFRLPVEKNKKIEGANE